MPRLAARSSSRDRLRAVALLTAALLIGGCGEQPTDLELARDAADIGDRVRAIGYYQRHLAVAEDDFDARLEYTLLLGEEWAFHGGDRRPILDNLAALYEAQPDNLRVRELFAMMLVREGQGAAEARRVVEAEAYYLNAVDVHPDVGTAHYHLAVLYEETGRDDDAFAELVAAALKRPQIPDLYLRLGRAYLARGDLDRAVNTLELVGELRGISTYLLPQANCELARAHQQRGDSGTARSYLERAVDGCVAAGPDGD